MTALDSQQAKPDKETLRDKVRSCVLGGQADSVENLADALGFGVSTLKKRFKDQYGITIGQYCKFVRLEDAAQLLAASDMPIGQIAMKAGYRNFGKFSSAFKRIYSLTPSEYRNKKARISI